MAGMTCPHCYTAVPMGATVCRGCNAEVNYGAPIFVLKLLALIGLAPSVAVVIAFDRLNFGGFSFLVGVGAWFLWYIFGNIILYKIFKNKITFYWRR